MISKEYGWNHSLSDVLTSLIEAGLHIDALDEFDASPYDVFPDLEINKQGYFELKTKQYPLLFAVKATKH